MRDTRFVRKRYVASFGRGEPSPVKWNRRLKNPMDSAGESHSPKRSVIFPQKTTPKRGGLCFVVWCGSNEPLYRAVCVAA
jgi:hypothetical protein